MASNNLAYKIYSGKSVVVYLLAQHQYLHEFSFKVLTLITNNGRIYLAAI